MKRSLALLLACLALGLVVAGCGGDDEESADEAQTTEEPAEEPAAGGGGAKEVSMEGIKFNPAQVTVKAGDTVTWTNDDSAPHNAVDEKTSAFKSELFNKGETYEFTAKEPGEIAYVCTIHPGMEGTLTVTE